MHILIPYAAPAGASIAQVLNTVQAPNLVALLKLLDATQRTEGSPLARTPLHEQVLAQTTWPGATFDDGLVPWAAADARKTLAAPTTAQAHWAWLTLSHWIVNADHVEMADPDSLQVTDAESLALMDAMRPYFAEDGITLHALASGTWLAEGEVFKSLPTASLDRVRGTQVDAWIPRQPQAKPLRRLQNEMQMLLYTHPVNDARAARGLSAINAFWISGTGSLPTPIAAPPPAGAQGARQPVELRRDLQAAALRDDATGWLAAWQALDSGPLAQLLQSASNGGAADAAPTLTLCGENAAQTLSLRPRTAWTRLTQRFATPDIPSLLKSL